MNFISCDAAYSLYPKATFKSSTALICKDVNDVRTESAIDKYRNRGWKIYDDIYDLDYKRDYYAFQERWVGDRHCWTIPLDTTSITERVPFIKGSPSLTCDPIVACSWVLRGTSRGEMAYCVVTSNTHLEFDYIMIRRSMLWKLMRKFPKPLVGTLEDERIK